MNKKKIIGIIALIVAVVSIFSLFADEIKFNSLTIEDKLLYGKNHVGDMEGKTMLCYFEIDDGYIHAESFEDTVSILHTSKDFSVVVAISGFSEESMNKDNYTTPLESQLFAVDRYVNCYEHKDGLKIFADGKELNVYTFTFEGKKDTYEMDLWYIKADVLPKITVEI